MNTLNTFVPLIAVISYTILLVISLTRRSPQEKQLKRWLGFLAVSIIWEFSLFFAADIPGPKNLSVQIITTGTLLLGATTAVYLTWPRWRTWFVLGLTAVIASLLIDLLLPNYLITWPNLPLPSITYGTLTTYLTWFALNSYLLLKTRQEYRRTPFPWHANRLIFWSTVLLVTMAGEWWLFLTQPTLSWIGQLIRFIGVWGLTHVIFSQHLFDVRTRIRRVLAFIIITLFSALPLVMLILLVQWLTKGRSLNTTLALTAVVLIVSFFLYQPFRQAVERYTYRFLRGEPVDPRKVVRNYSQAISRTLDVQQLSKLIVGLLSEMLEANRGVLMLVTQAEDGYDVEPIPMMGQPPREKFKFATNGRFIHSLLESHQPILEYDIEYNPSYSDITPIEKAWLKELAMEVYVPISGGQELEGLIAIGPKSSGLPYQHNELELAQILADQTVVALQNARLYSELGSQNDQIRRLNLDLMSQNERLEIMDRVKSDFITIASHELRTPLTQVKGYSDILASMNDENALTRDQTREIVSHINRATVRLEGLISAMLDASQIDVEGMQLSFVETRMDTIIRLASDPLAPAIRERRIVFSLEVPADLPPLQADFKRLVQAFTNLVGNAVKYTPDHGSIKVEASLVPGLNGEGDFIEVVVADTGIGIDPKFHELVFEKFFRVGDPQLHSTGNTKFKGAGPGLGLPIAKGVIEAHGGRIWVESPGEDETHLPGSQFHVLLPVQPKTVAQPNDTKSQNGGVG